MFLERVYDRRLAQASYVIGCQATGEALVVDPARDIRAYLEIAEREGLRIAQVSETHVHADYLSGARELAAATGATLRLSAEGGERWQYRFAHEPLHDGDEIAVGNVRLSVLHTPGHTPEHLSFLLLDPAAGDPPRMIFTGDALFVGDVGRPDLLEAAAGLVGTSEEGARTMFDTVQRFAALPDHVVVWPGHGSGSACGKSLGAVPVSTIGYERRANWAFGETDRERFVQRLLDGQPDAPRYFAQMKRLNLERPATTLRIQPPQLPVIDSASLARLVETESVQLVDLRPTPEFATGHVPGSINIPLDDGMVSWFGWLLEYDEPIVLIGPEAARVEAADALASIGLDSVLGGASVEQIEELVTSGAMEVVGADALRESPEAVVIDVRTAPEREEGAIPGALHLPLTELSQRLDEVPEADRLVVYCQGGYRSAIAASLLERVASGRVASLDGGYLAWKAEQAAFSAGGAR